MNIQTKIRSILAPICPDVYANVRVGSPNKTVNMSADFIVYALTDNRPALWGDDHPQHQTYTVRVNYYTKDGTKIPNKRKQIRAVLESAGFIWQSTAEMYENDTGYTHLVIDAEIEEFYTNNLEG